MPPIRVGINGFGRIGRQVFRAIDQRYSDQMEVVVVNDLFDPATLAHNLTWDTIYGKYPGEVKAFNGGLIVNDQLVAVCGCREPTEIPWGAYGAQIVIESTGFFTDALKARDHISGSGVKKVLISAPAKNEDITIVMGVNHHTYDPKQHHIISNASCTTNGLAPLAMVLHDSFGVEKGILTTVHSKTGTQSLTDSPKKNLRDGRAASENIVPSDTGAAKALELVIPSLKGRFTGISFRVPTPTVSVIDFTAVLGDQVWPDQIREAMLQAAEGPLKGILDVTDEELVSSDFIGNTHSSIFSSVDTKVIGNLVKVVGWYDNEYGYACRLADLAKHVAERL